MQSLLHYVKVAALSVGLWTCLLIMKGQGSHLIRTVKEGVKCKLRVRRLLKELAVAAETTDSGSRSQFISTLLVEDQTLLLKKFSIWVICRSVTNNRTSRYVG